MTNRSNKRNRRLHVGLLHFLLAAALVTVPGITIAQGLDIRNNEDRRTVITSTAGNHAAYTLAGTVLPFPFDKPPESSAYGLDIFLRFIPPVLQAPPRVVVRPNFGQCQYRYTLSDHLRDSTSIFSADPNALFDYENVFGITLPTVPTEWGLLDNGGEFPGENGQIVYGDFDPEIWHYNTGAYVSITRRDRDTGQNRYLFSNTSSRDDYLRGDFITFAAETFDIGNNFIDWSAETKIDIIFDVAFTPFLFAMEAKNAMKAARPGTRIAAKGQRPWTQRALAALRKLPDAMKRQMIKAATKAAVKRGISISSQAAFDSPTGDLTAWPTGTISRSRQAIAVLDEVPPTVRAIRQPEPFEANSPGGEFAQTHYDTLRGLMEVSDNCGRDVILTSAPTGSRFWPVGQTTRVQWCGRDLGPNADGETFERCADFDINVVDTRPPVLFVPPSKTTIASSPQMLDIGVAGAFDVADLNTNVSSDAPNLFPVGRTRVTWTATDSSGNSSTGEQWVSVKSSNSAPNAEDQFVGAVTSFEPTRIDLFATDPDPALDGQFDQLSFRISERPQQGFFIAPLFPYFIEDHRSHQINPDGSYNSYVSDAQAACEQNNVDITSPGMITRPFMVDVRDDGTTYVMDDVYRCDTGGSPNPFSSDERRIARFVTDEDGVMQFHSEYSLGSTRPPPESQQLAFDKDENAYVIRGDNIIVLDQNMTEIRRIRIQNLTRFSSGRLVRAYPSSGNSMLATIAISPDQILYTTNGYEIFAYDLTRTVAEAGVAEAGEDPDNLVRLRSYAFRPTDPTFRDEEPFLSWGSFTTQDSFTDLEVDSEGNLYASSQATARVYKWRGETLLPDRSFGTPPEFIGWMGACDANLDPAVQACDVANQRSFGFACQDDLCGPNLQEGISDVLLGSEPGQFYETRGIDISPRDELYVVDGGANNRIQRFTSDGLFAGEARSACGGSCFILGDFGIVTHISVNSHSLYVLDPDRELTHVFETTPITDVDGQTMQQRQSAFVLYQSRNNYIGPDNFSFFASDGLADSSPARVDLEVVRAFRAPVAERGIEVSGFEDQVINLPLAGSDPDADTLSFRIVTEPEHGTIQQVGENWQYTPDADYYGSDSFEFVASDAPSSMPALESQPESVAINILPVNDAPVIEIDEIERVGLGYPVDVVIRVTDVDAADVHRIGVDWGDGSFEAPLLAQPMPGEGTGFDLGQVAEVILTHTYGATGSLGGSRTLVVCASDAASTAPLTSCSQGAVNAVESVTVTPTTMVDLVVTGGDSLAAIVDQETTDALLALSGGAVSGPQAMLTFPEPVVDGVPVTYTFTTFNAPPAAGTGLTATQVETVVNIPDELTVDSYAPNDASVTCTDIENQRRITCRRDSLAPDESFDIVINARGSGRILEDAVVTLLAEATATEEDPTETSGTAIVSTLLYSGDNDADGDGIPNNQDDFPADPTESRDTDGDGIGNNADLDDDNDGMPDGWEQRFNFDSLNATDATQDTDADGLTNLQEYRAGSRPDNDDTDGDGTTDGSDNCVVAFNRNQYDQSANTIGDLCDADSFASAVAVGDLNANGATDYALIRTEAGTTTAYIKDGELDRSVGAGEIVLGDVASARPVMAIAIDGAGGATDKLIALLAQESSGRILVRAWDPANGALAFELTYFENADVETSAVNLAQIGLDGGAALAVAGFNSSTGEATTEIRRVDNGELVASIDLASDNEIQQVIESGDGSGVVTLTVDRVAGGLTLTSHSIVDGSVLWQQQVAGEDALRGVAAGSAGNIAVLVQTDAGDSLVSLWNSNTGAAVASFDVFDSNWHVLDLVALALPEDGREVVAVLASAADGEIRAALYDTGNGSDIQTSSFFSASDAPRSVSLAHAGARNQADLGVLVSDSGGMLTFALQSATDAANVRTLQAESSVEPPPPPPPPPPPQPPGQPSSGGGGSVSAQSILGLLLLIAASWAATARPLPGNRAAALRFDLVLPRIGAPARRSRVVLSQVQAPPCHKPAASRKCDRSSKR